MHPLHTVHSYAEEADEEAEEEVEVRRYSVNFVNFVYYSVDINTEYEVNIIGRLNSNHPHPHAYSTLGGPNGCSGTSRRPLPRFHMWYVLRIGRSRVLDGPFQTILRPYFVLRTPYPQYTPIYGVRSSMYRSNADTSY